MRRLGRHPLLHFLVLGALLWGLQWLWQDFQFRQVDAPSAQTIARLEAEWSQRTGRQSDPTVRRALIENEIDERILFREALRLKLHRRDPVVLGRLDRDIRFLGLQVPAEQRIQTALDLQLYAGDEVIRRRLLERMRAIGRGPDPQPSEAQLHRYRAAEPQRWQQPPRLSLEHVYVRAGPDALESLQALQPVLTELPQYAGDADWPGDPFLLGHSFQAISQSELGQQLGPAFAAKLWSERPEDEQWSEPLSSRYGWHRVRILEHIPGQALPFEQIRERLAAEWRAEQQQQRLQAWLQHLRGRYRVNQ